MAACKIDPDASPVFRKLVSRWKKDYPRIADDLQPAYKRISQDYRGAGDAIPKFGQKVWKCRVNSSDIRRGARYGWRVIAYYNESNTPLYPILVYPKTQWSDVSD